MKVVILGAGVIGVTSAYFLARYGHQVTVIEKDSGPALSSSYANGGQLSYSHIENWAAKAALLSMAKAVISPGWFFSVWNFTDKKYLQFIYQFYKNSVSEISRQNSKNLFAISAYSREVFSEILAAEKELEFDYKKQGILHFYRNLKKFEAAVKEAEFHNSFGCRAHILKAEECLKKEPALIKIFDEKKLAGGIFYEADASGNCFAFVNSLEKICRQKYGVIFKYETEVKNILTNHKKITGINSGKEVFVADKYIYALGAYGNKILNGIGIDPKIYPLKGYSLSVNVDADFIAPKLALSDIENKIVYSRLGAIFRIAGTAEICGLRSAENKKHLTFLKKTAFSTFSDCGNLSKIKNWSGFRPFRTNSIPLICEVKKYGNLLLNTGHGSLGWTLAAASGKILSDLISGRQNDRQENNKFKFLEDEEKGIYTKSHL
jgi:D-amino-acid dehydrogenase